jgi:hypothetical protein
MTGKTTPRPVCVYCYRAYGTRATVEETVEWYDGREEPEYEGEFIVAKEKYCGVGGEDGHTHTLKRFLWDGVTWIKKYEPFCSPHCALYYARASYNNTQKGKQKCIPG